VADQPEPEPQHEKAPDATQTGTDSNEHMDWGRTDRPPEDDEK
jgi:hypothetical protein